MDQNKRPASKMGRSNDQLKHVKFCSIEEVETKGAKIITSRRNYSDEYTRPQF